MNTKPFLKWAGGKAKLVPFIATHLPKKPCKRLIEPFAGSAALSLALDFDAYLLNDTNPDLIGLFQTLKQEKQSFIEYARSFFISENNQEARFYELREQFNHGRNITERSALFVYLNRHAFNSLCCYNSKGMFNVPLGRYRAPYFPATEMQAFVDKSERIELICGDFQAALNQAGDDDVVYCELSFKETMAITMIDPFNICRKEFEDSHLLSKLKKAVVVARTVGRTVDEPSFIYDIAELDLKEGSELYEAVKADYDLVRQVLLDPERGFASLTGRMGRYIQPRTKRAGHGSTSRAFYARKLFLSQFIDLNIV